MSSAIERLQSAQRQAMAIRPKVGGFPVLAETLRRAGVRRNVWSLPSTQSIYCTTEGAVVEQGTPLASGPVEVPIFDEAGVVQAIRTDQAGESTLPEFLAGVWQAGVVEYECDFTARTVTYRGAGGEEYIEAYPDVELPGT